MAAKYMYAFVAICAVNFSESSCALKHTIKRGKFYELQSIEHMMGSRKIEVLFEEIFKCKN